MIKTREDGVEVKHCTGCGHDKELSEFYFTRNGDGLDYYCKTCRCRRRRERYREQMKAGSL